MSEELEWELYDVFEAGLFAFPLYEHQTARKIVRYLIYRGVLEEEIADAIEDSTIDLHVWLNRQGKNMVGEWVIAWVNDVRDEYLAEKAREARENGYEFRETISREREGSLDHGGSSDGDAPDGGGGGRGRRRRRIHDESGSEVNSDDDETEVKRPISPASSSRTLAVISPAPPLPPRTLAVRTHSHEHIRHIDSSSETDSIDEQHGLEQVMQLSFAPRPRSQEFFQQQHHTPDSGAVSDIYSTIPNDSLYEEQCNGSVASQKLCEDCTCTLAHYAYLNKPNISVCTTITSCKTTDTTNLHNGGLITSPISIDTTSPCDVTPSTSSDSGCNYIMSESTIRAMELHIDTLDRDGPGYIFIMTDSLENCLPWSSEHRYKVGASRRPERFLTEFRAMNISIELIWQVRVDHHMKAVKEIHSCLGEYNLHSNWFKCSLSIIMDTISKTVRKYRSA